MNHRHALLQFLDQRNRCLLPASPNAWDATAFDLIGLKTRGLAREDYVRFEFDGLSPLILWDEPMKKPPFSIPNNCFQMVGLWGDVDRIEANVFDGEGAISWCEFRRSTEHAILGDDELQGLLRPSRSFEDRMRGVAFLTDRLRGLGYAIESYTSLVSDMRAVEDLEEGSVVLGRGGIIAGISLEYIGSIARREASAYVSPENCSRNRDEVWVKAIETALLTEWLFYFVARPLDWAPAVLAYAKSIETIAVHVWQHCICELVPESLVRELSTGKHPIKFNENSWSWQPGLGDLISYLALGHASNMKAGRPSQMIDHQSFAGESWIDRARLRDRIDSWDNNYLRLCRSGVFSESARAMIMVMQRFASRCHEAAKANGWEGGLANALPLLDAYRHKYRNGPAHSLIMSIEDACVARRLCLGPFQMMQWPEVPLFNRRRSFLSLFLPAPMRTHCERGLPIARQEPQSARAEFLSRFPCAELWLLDPLVSKQWSGGEQQGPGAFETPQGDIPF